MKDPIPYDANVAADVRAVARIFGLPVRVLRHWQREGVLSAVLTVIEWEGLNMLRRAWRDPAVLRAMLARMSKAEREQLARDAGRNELERLVYRDMLRFKLIQAPGTDMTGSIYFRRYRKQFLERYPNLGRRLTREVFARQKKAAINAIAYARRSGTLDALIKGLRLVRQPDGAVASPRSSDRPQP